MNLTFENRLLIAKILCKSNNGKLPLILGAGFYCMQDTLNFIDETSNLDFDAYHIMPYHPKLSMNLLVDYYKKIADFSKNRFGYIQVPIGVKVSNLTLLKS